MSIGERIEQRRKALGIRSQSQLARDAKMGQSTLNGLIRKPYRWSPHLPALARALQTTVDYLVGDTDDPDLNAPVPQPQHPPAIWMQIQLPSEDALAEMFEGLLMSVDQERPLAEQARLLAQSLPIGLSRLRDVRPPRSSAARGASKGPEDQPTPNRGPQR